MRSQTLMAAAALFVVLACEKQPASLSVEPRDFLPLEKKGKTVQLKAQTKDDRNVFLATVQPQWESKDPSVATVDETGLITAAGTGTTEIVGKLGNLTASVPVTVKIVGSVEISPSEPQKLRMSKSTKLTVTVKDDKGRVLPGEKVLFKTVGYGVDVEADGTVTGQATGETIVVAVAKDKEARVKFEVTD